MEMYTIIGKANMITTTVSVMVIFAMTPIKNVIDSIDHHNTNDNDN